MTDVLRMGRRVFTIGVVAATIAWTIGLSALIQPLTTRAASSGDLIKGSLPAVYYYGPDSKRYVFPNEKTFNTWYTGFSGVVTLSDAEIAAIPIGDSNVVYRAGTRLVKIQTDPKVYAVEPDGTLRWIESEAIASALFGSNWASRVDDVPDVFFVDYTPGASLSSASVYPSGSLVSSTTSDEIYYIDGSSKRLVSSMSANRFNSTYVVETSQSLSAYTSGTAITAAESALTDTAQTGVTAPVTTGGGLTVTLASDTPAGISMAQGAAGIGLLAINLTAGSGDVTLSGLAVKRFGVGASSNWSNLYLYDGATRLTDGRSVNSTTQLASFTGLSIKVSAGTVKKIWLKGDLGTSLTSGGTHGFQIADATAITSTASSVTGAFPVSGNQFTVGAATAGTLDINSNGTVGNPSLGTKQAEVGRFNMVASTEDITVSRIQFTIDGTVRYGDMTNFTLKQGSTTLATSAGMTADGKGAVLEFTTPYKLTNGLTRSFSLYADIGGEAARTIGLRVKHSADVVAIGSLYNQGVQVDVGGYNGGTTGAAAAATCSATGQDCTYVTVQGSTLTLAFNGPTAANVSSNTQDHIFLKFSLTAAEYTMIDDFAVIIACNGGTSGCDAGTDAGDLYDTEATTPEANIKDIKVRVAGGATIMGPSELTAFTGSSALDTTQTITFTEDLVLQAGESLNLEVTADVDDTAVAADIFRATVDVSGITAEDVNGDSVSSSNIVPSADITGNNQTVQAAGLTVNHSVPPSDGSGQTTIKGTTGKDTVGYSFTAADGSAITITAMTLATLVDSDATSSPTTFVKGADTINAVDVVSSVSLYDSTTGELVSGPENVRTSPAGDVIFDNFLWTVPSGQTKKLVARINVANYTVSGNADGIAFFLEADSGTTGDTADVTAQDADGNSVTASISTNNGTVAAPTTYLRVSNAGSMSVSAHADTPRSDILLAGATDVTVAKFRVDATNEAFSITKLRIQDMGATDLGGTIGDMDNNIAAVKLSYPKQDGSTGTATSFFVAGNADFNGLSMYVPANNNATLTVMASLQTIENGATRGERPRFQFDSTSAGNFEAIGVSSGGTLTGSDVGDANGNRMVVRETEPTFALASGSPTTGVAGAAEVLRFSVAAAAGEAVVLDMVTFKITSTDNNGDSGTAGVGGEWYNCMSTTTASQLDASDFTLYETSVGVGTPLEGGDSDWSLLDGGADACTSDTERAGFARLNLTTPVLIAAGTTKTFSVQVDTTGASTANDDTFRVEIPAEPMVALASFLTSASTTVGDDLGEDNLTMTDTIITVGAAASYAAGQYICIDTADNGCASGDEIAFITGVSSTDLTVVRGVLGTTPVDSTSNDTNDDVDIMPASVVWDDDGDSSTVDMIDGYLLSLPIVGATHVY